MYLLISSVVCTLILYINSQYAYNITQSLMINTSVIVFYFYFYEKLLLNRWMALGR